MKQILFTGKGQVEVCDVPVPAPLPRSALVRTMYSLISTGTEGASVAKHPGWRGALEKVRQRPERLRQAWNLARTVGLSQAYGIIQQKLDDYTAPGYSCVGRVVEVSEPGLSVKVGDVVACVGAGIAVHAEYVTVPENLLVALPDGVEPAQASFGALLCIAMQGIRRLELPPGEIIAVIGLGLIGQIVLQLLRAMGYRIVGFDVRSDRAEKARELGFGDVWSMADMQPEAACARLTGGHGVDGVIVAAATSSNEPVNLAFDLCRRGGRVSVIGDIGLGLERARMYRKEIELRMSCSYGPGRYDDEYELGGRDYPYSYVRWTEKRNLEYALSLIGSGRIDLRPLMTKTFAVASAPDAYALVKSAAPNAYGVLFDYGAETIAASAPPPESRSVSVARAAPGTKQINLGVIGVGSFCNTVHLPNLAHLKDIYSVAALASRSGVSAIKPARRYQIPVVTTDYREILRDRSIDAVLIATRHSSHARVVLEALEHGKHVFVEKPMCLTEEEGGAIVESAAARGLIVQVGFNRRYAPMMGLMKAAIGGGPRTLLCRVNVGSLGNAWSNAAGEGGRLLGEGVHFFDLCNWFMDGEPIAINAMSIGKPGVENPNVTVSLAYQNGCTAQVLYTTLGDSRGGKEYYEAFGNGRMVVCDDFLRLSAFGTRLSAPRASRRDKGLKEELVAFAAAVRGESHPIARPDGRAGLAATRIALQVHGAHGVPISTDSAAPADQARGA